MINDETLLNEIKKRLSVTGNYHDELLLAYANDVKGYMHGGGIPLSVIDGSSAVGVICRGVADLWNLGAGDGHFSDMFDRQINQLALTKWKVADEDIPVTPQGTPLTLTEITTNEIDECTACLEQPSGVGGEQLIFVAASEEDIDAYTNCLEN